MNIRCYVMTMKLSDGREDYYVTIEKDGRQITPHVFRYKGHAEYEVADWNWLFNGGEKPDMFDFDLDTMGPGWAEYDERHANVK